jgi:hypothetical protein
MPCEKASQRNYIIALYSTKLFVALHKKIPLEDINWSPGVKITQAVEASLRVCHLAPSANTKYTYDSLDIFHSEKEDINNYMSTKKKTKTI